MRDMERTKRLVAMGVCVALAGKHYLVGEHKDINIKTDKGSGTWEEKAKVACRVWFGSEISNNTSLRPTFIPQNSMLSPLLSCT